MEVSVHADDPEDDRHILDNRLVDLADEVKTGEREAHSEEEEVYVV